MTARISLIIFILVFIARPYYELCSSSLSAWLLQHRKLIGICFGFSLAAHIVLIFWLFLIKYPGWPDIVGTADIAIGGPGLVLVMAMTATSFQFVRSRMPPALWRGLHKTGLYLVWFVFAACLISSYFDKSPPNPGWHYVPLIALLLLALLLRVLAIIKKRTPRVDEASA